LEDPGGIESSKNIISQIIKAFLSIILIKIENLIYLEKIKGF
jgi:hypothetical protein